MFIVGEEIVVFTFTSFVHDSFLGFRTSKEKNGILVSLCCPSVYYTSLELTINFKNKIKSAVQ